MRCQWLPPERAPFPDGATFVDDAALSVMDLSMMGLFMMK